MKKFVKSLLALGVTSAITLSVAHAAQYKAEFISPEQSTHQYTYGQFQNGTSQEYILSGTNSYNFPVIVEYLFNDLVIQQDTSGNVFASFSFGGQTLGFIYDLEAYLSGTPVAQDIELSVNYLKANAGNLNYQQATDLTAFIDFGNGAEKITVWDENISLQFPFLTRSTQDYLSGITSNGWLYGTGSAPSLPYTYTNDSNDILTFWLSDFSLKGFVSLDNGNTIKAVESPFNLYGGVSAVLDMAEVDGNQVAVGYASISYNATILNGIESTDTSGCKSSANNAIVQAACIESVRASLYNLGAFKWTFDNNGNVIDNEILGTLVENKHVDDARNHVSHALAINSSGVAVGFSTGFVDIEETNPVIAEPVSTYAVLYKDGGVIDITADRTKMFASRATDINEDGIAAGYVTEYVNGSARTSAFYLDTNADEMTMQFPEKFFVGSSSTVSAINDNGFIVGEAEVERHADTSVARRRNAFLYDTNTETLTNLNDFLECNSGYEIIEAKDINNLNEITATALVKTPVKDAKGEDELDADGNIQYEDTVRAVKLTPIAGEIENCDAEEGNLIERQGASFSWFFIMLTTMLGFSRRISKK